MNCHFVYQITSDVNLRWLPVVSAYSCYWKFEGELKVTNHREICESVGKKNGTREVCFFDFGDNPTKKK
jgi:hypothetical protein